MRKEEVVKLLKDNMEQIKKFGVKNVGIFGSSVRDELNDNSDIDLVIEFERVSLKNFIELVEFLENLFNKPVDILTPKGVESIRIKSIKERIKKEIEYV